MTPGRVFAVVAGLAAVGVAGWGAWLAMGPSPAPPAPISDSPATPAATSHITTTLFFGARSGNGLVATRVEVPLASTVAAQGEAILRAALADPPPGMLRVIPRGTRLRAFYVDARGEAFVDLTSEVTRLHPGGSFGEALTVGAVVNAVTANLGAVHSVRVLVDGQAVETLAGHIDVSRALTQDMSLVVTEKRP